MKPFTLHKLLVESSTYDILKNFCEDFKIKNIPSRDCMFFELGSYEGFQQPKRQDTNTTYLMRGLYLEVVDAVSGDGKILLLAGESPSLEEKFYDCLEELDEELEILSDEPTVAVVLSNNFDNEVKDLAYLETELKNYLDDTIKLYDIKTVYTTDEDILNYLLDGRKAEQD
jgi:hypothetical protein